ncbi:MAG: ABC transporter substrate-binding protein [Eubacteriales bacterium]|nr:ABC transporter substrate-binding protein [Eubacteriales bacterium]
MKTTKRLILAVLCISLIASMFAGCGSRASYVEEDLGAVPKDTYEINWVLYTAAEVPDAKAVERIEAKVNEYLKDKINATVNMTYFNAGQYAEKMNAKISANEYYDICFAASWMLSYKATAKLGAWVGLDDVVESTGKSRFETYMPGIYKEVSSIYENLRADDGNVYGVPVPKEFAENRGWAYRKDIADEMGLNPESWVHNSDYSRYKSFKLIKNDLLKVKAQYPEFVNPIDWDGQRTPTQFLGNAGGVAYLSMFEHLWRDNEDYKGKIVDMVTTPEYQECLEIARDFVSSGLIKGDVATATDFDDRVKAGKTFAYAEFLKPGKTAELKSTYKYDFGQIDVTPISLGATAGPGSMMTISRNSKNPVRCMRFLELFNTDEYLHNLIIFGEEGTDYKVVGKADNGVKVVDVIKKGGYTNSGNQWAMGNVFIDYVTTTEDPEKGSKLKEYNAKGIPAQNLGFSPDLESLKTYTDALKQIQGEYKLQLELGTTSKAQSEKLIAEMQERMEQNKKQEVWDELQKQFTEFCDANPQNFAE